MFFVGIDLAWSNKNSTGIAIIEGDEKSAKLCGEPETVSSNDEIINYIKKFVKNENAFIAIDAPLIVPNNNGQRKAEHLLNKLFKKYDAVTYPSNKERLVQCSGETRGEELCKALEKENFKHDPYIKQFENERKFFEIYPHSSMVVLFKLDKILRYKKRSKRTHEDRWKEFKNYQFYLKKLSSENPSLMLSKDIVEKNVEGLKGKKLKEYEDVLDAVFCAYVAYYYWVNTQRCEVIGNINDGYIVTLIFPDMYDKIHNP